MQAHIDGLYDVCGMPTVVISKSCGRFEDLKTSIHQQLKQKLHKAAT